MTSSQSEISEIISGRRAVVSYDVLVRIGDGLGVPRGWMGLAASGTADDQRKTSSDDELPLL